MRGAGRSMLGGAQSFARAERRRLADSSLREDFLEGLAISLEELPVFRALLVLIVLKVVEGCRRPSKPVEHVGQSENRQQRRNRNQGISIVGVSAVSTHETDWMG